MKACVLEENKKLVYKEVEQPVTEDNNVLIKVKACGICSSDFNRVHNNGAYFYPIILGHEFAGKIIECGKNISKEYLNKNAVVFPLMPCNNCEFCQQKLYAQCKNYNYFGSRTNGAMAQYISVPLWNIKLIPDDMDYSIAALCEPTSVAIHALKKINNLKGKTICISGSGAIGILCGLIAQKQGANVSFIVRNKRKQEFLENLGFNNFASEEDLNKFDIIIECVGSNSSIQNCIKYVKSHGTIIFVGNPAEDEICLPKKDYWKILRSEITIFGVWNSSFKNQEIDDWDSAINFLYENQKDVCKIITHRFSLKDELKAFSTEQNEKMRIKGVFINEE